MMTRRVAPARVALAVALCAVAGSLYLIAVEVLAPQSSAAGRLDAPSAIVAARGPHPGEPSWHRELQRWESP